MDILLIVAIIWFLVSKSKKYGGDESGSSSSWSETLSGMGRDLSDAAKRAEKGISSALKTEEDDRTLSAAELRRAFAGESKKKERPSPAEIRDRHEARLDAEWEASEAKHRREREASDRRFADARKKQADSLRVHAAGVDSCEGRLESLKVLYDAGILDKEEYTQRVARVKAQHRHSRP